MSPPPDLPPPDPPPPPPPPDPPPPHRVSLSLMVVPEGAPTCKLRVQKRDLVFKFIGRNSKGVAERHYGKRREPAESANKLKKQWAAATISVGAA